MITNFSSFTNHDDLRKEFPVLERAIYLNVGTYGIMPQPALSSFVELMSEFELGGVASRINLGEKSEQARKQVTDLIGVDSADDIAFNRNATDGINFLLAGLNLSEGDEVVTTREEHEAMYHPLLYLQKMRGIKVKWLDFHPDPDNMLSQLNRAYSANTRLISMSMVSCETGTRLPVRQICEWAGERDIITLIDGAQATGNIPVCVKDLGCDFYASNGHKWLCGPKGTGFFYGKEEKLDSLFLPYVGAGSLEKAVIESGEVIPWKNAHKFEFGTRSWGLHAGLGVSLDWIDQLGWGNIYQYNQMLSDSLKTKILNRPFLELISPRNWEDSSALVCFIVKGYNAGDVSRILNQQKSIHVRVIPHYNAIRISTAFFNNENDLEALMNVLDTLERRNEE